MSLALQTESVYEFDVETDILFFKVGGHGLVSFHGKNYNIKKRMSAEQLQKMIESTGFLQIKSDIFVNVGKISSVEDDYIYFGQPNRENKSLPVTKRKQELIKELLKN